MKNSNDTIGNRTRDFPACSTVPQRTAPPRARKFTARLAIYEPKSTKWGIQTIARYHECNLKYLKFYEHGLPLAYSFVVRCGRGVNLLRGIDFAAIRKIN